MDTKNQMSNTTQPYGTLLFTCCMGGSFHFASQVPLFILTILYISYQATVLPPHTFSVIISMLNAFLNLLTLFLHPSSRTAQYYNNTLVHLHTIQTPNGRSNQ